MTKETLPTHDTHATVVAEIDRALLHLVRVEDIEIGEVLACASAAIIGHVAAIYGSQMAVAVCEQSARQVRAAPPVGPDCHAGHGPAVLQ